jgi:hypothetical protein
VPFGIALDPGALQDIQEAIQYYEGKKQDLGMQFLDELDAHFELLQSNPRFSIRYDKVRCLPLKKFPFMIHFTLLEVQQKVVIWAVLGTSIDPNKWKKAPR